MNQVFRVFSAWLGVPEWRVGDWVEVCSANEILATLDEEGCLDALPFMPEMLPFCGRRFQIMKVAHKSCDPTGKTDLRRMKDAVHLETRCDGCHHDGCQAECALYWKTAWLKRADGPAVPPGPISIAGETIGSMGPRLAAAVNGKARGAIPTVEMLERATRVQGGEHDGIRYRCQTTEIVRATTPLSSAAPWQFIHDLASGNIRPTTLIWYLALAILKTIKARVLDSRPVHGLRWLWRRARGKNPAASMVKPTWKPIQPLNLQPDEWVRIRSKDEVMATLNKDRKNLGLSFDPDMVRHCGGDHRVRRRVDRVIDERTGRMLKISRDCLILDGVTCQGLDCRNRLFCTRGAYMFWREAWLKRVESPGEKPGR